MRNKGELTKKHKCQAYPNTVELNLTKHFNYKNTLGNKGSNCVGFPSQRFFVSFFYTKTLSALVKNHLFDKDLKILPFYF